MRQRLGGVTEIKPFVIFTGKHCSYNLKVIDCKDQYLRIIQQDVIFGRLPEKQWQVIKNIVEPQERTRKKVSQRNSERHILYQQKWLSMANVAFRLRPLANCLLLFPQVETRRGLGGTYGRSSQYG